MTDQPNQEDISKKIILVAEDDLFYANIYKVKLEKEGFKVIIAGDGQKALLEARAKKPNLLLLDLVMPIKDGFDTLQEIKADDELKDINVVVLSNLGQEEDKKKVRELGAIDYFIKTEISIQELVDKVKKYIK